MHSPSLQEGALFSNRWPYETPSQNARTSSDTKEKKKPQFNNCFFCLVGCLSGLLILCLGMTLMLF